MGMCTWSGGLRSVRGADCSSSELKLEQCWGRGGRSCYQYRKCPGWGHVYTHLLPSQVGGMPVGQQGSEQGAESQSRVWRSTGEREPELQASQLETFPATTVPQAPSDLERNYMVEALQQLGIDVRPLMRPTSRKPYPDWIDRVHQFPRGYKVPEFVLF